MARSFNGSSDVIVLSAQPVTAVPATLSVWVYPASTAMSYGTVFEGGVTGHTLGLFLNATHFAYYDGTKSVDPGSATISANTWYHVVQTVDTTSITAYVNGTSDGQNVTGAQSFSGTSAQIGYDNSNAHWNGRIADIAIWNVVLTANEISALAKGARPHQIRKPNLIYWAPLDGKQSPEPDLSGKAISGTLTGTSLAFGPPYMPFTPRWPISLPEPPPSQISVSYQRAQQILMTGP
jgi:hypothetical protein